MWSWLKGKNAKKNPEIKLSYRALSDFDLLKYAKPMEIYFQSLFMRTALPIIWPRKFKSPIVNLDNEYGLDMHWVAYKKVKNNVEYFDSFGHLRPPLNLVKYLCVNRIKYNHDSYQNYNTFVCGHLCLKFLCNQLKLKSILFIFTLVIRCATKFRLFFLWKCNLIVNSWPDVGCRRWAVLGQKMLVPV